MNPPTRSLNESAYALPSDTASEETMKKYISDLSRAILVVVALALVPASWCFAQDTERVVVTPLKDTAVVQQTASGNITNVTADAMFIKAAGDQKPQGYVINANTAYVD